MSNDRGPFQMVRKRAVRVVRKRHGEPEREVYLDMNAQADDESTIDSFMQGLSRRDLAGPSSGFGRSLARVRSADVGAGTDVVNSPQRSSGYDLHGDQGLDHSSIDRHEGETDLLGNEQGQTRTEYMDRVADHRSRMDQPGSSDQEDIWSTDVLDEFDEYSDQHDRELTNEPTFSGSPHRQLEARRSIEDELDDLFSADSATFSRRGL